MKAGTFLCLAGATLFPGNLLANGGGYFRGGLQRVGDLELFEPQEVEKVRILDEKLSVDLGPKEAAVEVRYVMRNETQGKVKVRMGFPVEELYDNDLMGGGGDPDAKDGKRGSKLKYCKDYVITAGGKELGATWKGEEKTGDGKEIKGIAGWLVSDISFEPGEEKPVMIRFRSGYPGEEWSVSDDTSSSAAVFKYRLSSAACWAGSLGNGRIVLRPSGIPAQDLKVIKPVNRFKKEGDNWVWNFENLEPALADDIEIEAVPATKTYGRTLSGGYGEGPRGTYVERGGKWTMLHANYAITASSTLAADGEHHYEADQLKSYSKGTWSEGAPGPGTGEWLLLKPQTAKPLAGIGIVPGYAATPELFKANARPKKILVELNGEHRFSVNVPDSPEYFEIPVTSFREPVKTVKLTFEEVWKGSKYEDLCVTGLSLRVKLDKKPEINPAR